MMNSSVISSSSKTYANALFATASENHTQEKLLTQLDEVCSVLKKSDDLREVLSNPIISVKVKHELIDEIFKPSLDSALLNFIKILAEKNRFSEIYSILDAYKSLYEKSLNQKKVEVLSAVELSDDIKLKITNVLRNKLNSDVIVSWAADENIIAGLIFKFDDFVIDTSMKTKLEEIGKNLFLQKQKLKCFKFIFYLMF